MNKQETRRVRTATKREPRSRRRKQRTQPFIWDLTSNFRLSLTFRIALSYSWQLMRTSLLALLVMTVIYAGTVLADIEQDIDRLRTAVPDDGDAYTQHIIQDSAISVQYLPDAPFTGGVLPFLNYRVISLELVQRSPLMTAEASHIGGGTIRILISLVKPASTWLWLCGAVILIDLIRMASFLRRQEKLCHSVLAPIRDITDMATTLSASNLSNRINIAGTKNELKDLAAVINTMLDRIERSYNSQKQFVSDASHELRTPIAVLQGYVRMLQRWGKSDPEVLDEGISAIAQETASMKELVESLLFLARHDKKTLMMEMTSFDILEVAEELHREAAMVTPEDRFVLQPAESMVIQADRNMIKQVLRILCDNAVKYTPKGGVITIGVQGRKDGVTLSIADNGPGIPADELPKIFERFYRSDAARKSEGGGHGLGLSIARIIVKAHGGKLRVRSKVGSGSTFYVDLPDKQPITVPEEGRPVPDE
ncbi:MAG: HAMP domain-containing histidine kinase [Clostridia bacterium]|nr:HAMP domain-containing histidine kinase [Clostridia bacterium]